MAVIGQGISLRGITHEDFHYPFYLKAGVVRADVGKAVAIDPTAPNTVRLAADGDQIIGKLVTVEDRAIEGVLVGTVALRGGFKFTVAAASAAFAVGDTAVGAGNGEVKARRNAGNTANEPAVNSNFVAEVGTGYVIVVR